MPVNYRNPGSANYLFHPKRGLDHEDVQIKISALWISLMLTYLLGDVLGIYSDDL